MLVIFLIPSVIGFSVDEFKFEILGNDVEYYNPAAAQVANMRLEIGSDQELSEFKIDISSLNRNPNKIIEYSDMDLLSDCTPKRDNETDNFLGYSCFKEAIALIIQNSSNEVTFYTVNMTGGEEAINHTVTFTLDDTQPEVVNIKTNFCEDNKCYVASTKPTDVLIEISDSVGTFYQKKIFYAVNQDSPKPVLNCSNNLCTGLYVGMCSGGARMPIIIGSAGVPSSDDAGNYFTGNLRTTVICDEKKPIVQSVSHDFAYEPLIPNMPIKQGDMITFDVNVSEDASKIKGYADFETLTGSNQTVSGNCVENGLNIKCSWQTQVVNAGDLTVKFWFNDSVGRISDVKDYTIHVDEFVQEGNQTMPTFFRDITAKPMAEKGFNRVALDLMNRNGMQIPIYATYQLSPIANNIEILKQDIGNMQDCLLKYPNGTTISGVEMIFNKMDVADPYADWNVKNRINIYFSNMDKVPNDFSVLCNLSLVVRENKNRVYEEASIVPIKIPMKFKNTVLGTPGEAVIGTIKEKEDNIKKYWQWMKPVDAIMASATDLCAVKSQITSTRSTLVGIQEIGLSFGDKGKPVVLKADKTKGLLDSVLNNKILNQICSFTNCNSKEAHEAFGTEETWFFNGGTDLNSYMEWGKENGGYVDEALNGVSKSLLENVNIPDNKNSIVTSVMTLCAPGIIYHINKYRQAECNRLMCYKQNARHALALTSCDQAMGQYTCQAVIGEAFEFPGIRQAKNLMDNANAFIQNAIPNALKILGTDRFCKDFLGKDAVLGDAKNHNLVENDDVKVTGTGSKSLDLAIVTACYVPEAILKIQEAAVKKTKGSASFTYPSQEDVCAAALCQEEDLSKCKPTSNSYFASMNSMNLFDFAKLNYKVNYEHVSNKEYASWLKEADSPTDKGVAARKNIARLVPSTKDMFGKDYEMTDKNIKEIRNYVKAEQAKVDEANFKPGDGVKIDEDGNLGIQYSQETEMEKYQNQISAIEGNADYLEGSLGKTARMTHGDVLGSAMELCFSTEECIEPTGFESWDDKDKKTYNNFKEQVSNRNRAYNNLENEFGNLVDELQIREAEINNNKKLSDDQKTALLNRDVYSRISKKDMNSLVRPWSDTHGIDEIRVNYLKKKKIELAKKNAVRATAQVREQVFGIMDQAASFAYTQGWLNWASLTEMGHNTAMGQVSSWSDEYLNSDNYKDGFCSWNSMNTKVSNSIPGSAIQCQDGMCRTVLTMASEKMKVNDTHHVYTIVYYVGNVMKPEMGGDDFVKYNVFLKGAGNVKKQLFGATWLELPTGYGHVHDYSNVFASQNNYNKVCLQFEQEFPPHEINGKKEYCRDIVDATDGSSDFDTGSPYVDSTGGSGSSEPSDQFALSGEL